MDAPQSPTISWRKNLFFIWCSQILSMAGYSSAMPFMAIYIRDQWGITNEHELGAWMSAFFFFGLLSFCVFMPLWGILADRYGRKRMLLRACYVDALLFPCFLLAPNPFWLIVTRFVISIFTGTVSAAQTLIVTTTPVEHHGFALGTLSSSLWSGNLLGFAAGGLIIHYFGFTVAFFGCGFMYLLAGILAHLFVQENFTPPTREQRKKAGSVWSAMVPGTGMIFLLILISAVARRFDDPYVALMVEKVHGPLNTAFHTGWVNALAAVGGVFSGMAIGRLCDRFSSQRVAIPALLLSAGSMFLEAVSMTLPMYGAARFLNYLVAGGLEPVFYSMLSKVSPENRRGTIFGMASSLRMTGILLGSAASGFLIYSSGVRNIYMTGALLFLLAVPCFWLTVRRLKKAPAVNDGH
ncbi:MAG: MFS transporter [Planctomycetia bacterium]|nr:MFS transporter [Planctomycetia bacterium]